MPKKRRSLVSLFTRAECSDWTGVVEAQASSRERRVEGLMLKRKECAVRRGPQKGDWWKWKVEPYSVDAVLVYAQQGHGRRAGLYTDYTFSVWDGEALVPFAKAYSGLSDAEIRRVDRWIRQHTREKHGPVRVVDLNWSSRSPSRGLGNLSATSRASPCGFLASCDGGRINPRTKRTLWRRFAPYSEPVKCPD